MPPTIVNPGGILVIRPLTPRLALASRLLACVVACGASLPARALAEPGIASIEAAPADVASGASRETTLAPNQVAYRVRIRLYDMARLPAKTRAAARQQAEAILAGAGLSALWIECLKGNSRGNSRACDAVPEPGELVVRVVRGAGMTPPQARLTLGYSLLDRDTGAGSFATVYMNRVESLARDSRTNATILLSRALAHEIGHLLLGTAEHSPTGLMRATWTAAELRAQRPDDWVFSTSDRWRVRDVQWRASASRANAPKS